MFYVIPFAVGGAIVFIGASIIRSAIQNKPGFKINYNYRLALPVRFLASIILFLLFFISDEKKERANRIIIGVILIALGLGIWVVGYNAYTQNKAQQSRVESFVPPSVKMTPGMQKMLQKKTTSGK